MNKITIFISVTDIEEEHKEDILDALKGACEFVGLGVESISMSGDTFIDKVFIEEANIVDVEFTEIEGEKSENNM